MSEQAVVAIQENILEALRLDHDHSLYPEPVHDEISSTPWAAAAAIARSPTEYISDGEDQEAAHYRRNLTLNDIIDHIEERIANNPPNIIATPIQPADQAPSSSSNPSNNDAHNPLANTSLHTDLPEPTHFDINALDDESEQDQPSAVFRRYEGISDLPSSDVDREYSPNYEARMSLGLRGEDERSVAQDDHMDGFESQVEDDSED